MHGFRALTVFAFTDTMLPDADTVASALSARPARPCLGHEPSTRGWAPVFSAIDERPVFESNRCLVMAWETEERLLPSSVVNETLDEKVAEIEAREGRRLRRQERMELKDEVVDSLLPRAFTRRRRTWGYMDLEARWLVIDGTSKRVVEGFVSDLRSTLGTLPIAPLASKTPPATAMTAWLVDGQLPDGLDAEGELELRGGGEQEAVIRCRGEDPLGAEIGHHLTAGKQVTRLALTWREHLALVLGDDWSLRRVRLTDAAMDDAELDQEDPVAAFDAGFTLFSSTLRQALPELLEACGGASVPAGSGSSITAAPFTDVA